MIRRTSDDAGRVDSPRKKRALERRDAFHDLCAVTGCRRRSVQTSIDPTEREPNMSTDPLHVRRRFAPLYHPDYERDACGVGLVVNISGEPSREIVERALGGLVNLTHRGGVGADE